MFETTTLINSMVTLKFATRSSICFKVVVKSSLKLKQIGCCQAFVGETTHPLKNSAFCFLPDLLNLYAIFFSHYTFVSCQNDK